MADENPNAPSSAYSEMSPAWRMVSAILAGVEALRVASSHVSVYGPPTPVPLLSQLDHGSNRSGPESPYLPRFRNETNYDYDRRRRTAPLTNIYADVSDNLSGKPFAKEVELADGAGTDVEKLAEDIDGQGNSLHVFAKDWFKAGIDKGIDWVLIEHTKVPPGATLADERAMGARPYWVHISCERLLAVYSAFIGGKEVLFHARIDETCVEMDGYGERKYERVRVIDRAPVVDPLTKKPTSFGPPTWKVFELQEDDKATDGKKQSWVMIDEGSYTVGIIPLVPFVPAGRKGTSWCVTMPIVGIAHLQVEEFQQESNIKHTKEMTAFPMLCGAGISLKNKDGSVIEVPVGPAAVLTSPPDAGGNHGDWKFIEPSSESLKFLQADLEKTQTSMRDLGAQPLTTANLTVITTANVAMKAHSRVQAWSLLFKDAVEQAFKVTMIWLKKPDASIEVKVHTDFGVELEAGKELESLLKAEGQGIYSKETIREEYHRRGVTGEDWSEEQEQERLAEEQKGLEAEQSIDPLTGLPVKIDPVTGRPIAMPPSQLPKPPPPPRPPARIGGTIQ